MKRLFAAVAAMLLALASCGVREAQPKADARTDWPDPATLQVTTEAIPVPGVTVVLVDMSKSNQFLGSMFTEVKALVEATSDTEEVCVMVISEDSQSSQVSPWCRGPLDPYSCVYPSGDIKPDGEHSSVTETRTYRAAEKRLKAELEGCEAARAYDRETRAGRVQPSLDAWIKTLVRTDYTDIEGAFSRAREHTVPGAWLAVWVYSDMEQDLKVPRSNPLEVDLANISVHVRELVRSGRGYNSAYKDQWTKKLEDWEAAEVDWKVFNAGEHTPPATQTNEELPAAGAEASVPGAAATTATSGQPPAPATPTTSSTPTRRSTSTRGTRPAWTPPKRPSGK